MCQAPLRIQKHSFQGFPSATLQLALLLQLRKLRLREVEQRGQSAHSLQVGELPFKPQHPLLLCFTGHRIQAAGSLNTSLAQPLFAAKELTLHPAPRHNFPWSPWVWWVFTSHTASTERIGLPSEEGSEAEGSQVTCPGPHGRSEATLGSSPSCRLCAAKPVPCVSGEAGAFGAG